MTTTIDETDTSIPPEDPITFEEIHLPSVIAWEWKTGYAEHQIVWPRDTHTMLYCVRRLPRSNSTTPKEWSITDIRNLDRWGFDGTLVYARNIVEGITGTHPTR